MLRPVPAAEPPSRRSRILKLVASAGLAAIALAAVARLGAVTAERDRLLAAARDAGLDRAAHRELAVLLHKESDPAQMRLEAARVLLSHEIARPAPWRTDETRARVGRILELARAVALEQPASYQALTIYASALTLLRTRTADTRLFTLSEQWERPLELAVELGPSYRFPKETLAFVYLEVWPAIAKEKRPQVEAILREAFEDEWTFHQLVGKWMRIAGSPDAAARLVPDTPWAWRAMVEGAENARDWNTALRLRAKLDAAVAADLEGRLRTAEERLALGNPVGARALADETLALLPVDGSATGRLERLLARRPAGPATPAAAQAAAAWVDWLEPLALLGRRPLSTTACIRLVSLAAGSLATEKAALAALAGGDLARGELYERRSHSLWSERWAPYLTLKALAARERGDFGAARAALDAAHRSFRARLPWALAADSVGLRPTEEDLRRGDPAAPRAGWEETDWIWSGGKARLELLPARDADHLWIELRDAAPAGGSLEAIWDGSSVGLFAVPAGERRVAVRVAVTAEPHLLALRPRGPGLRATARVELP